MHMEDDKKNTKRDKEQFTDKTRSSRSRDPEKTSLCERDCSNCNSLWFILTSDVSHL